MTDSKKVYTGKDFTAALEAIEEELNYYFKNDFSLDAIREHEEFNEEYIRKLNRFSDIIMEQRINKLSVNLWWVLYNKKFKNG